MSRYLFPFMSCAYPCIDLFISLCTPVIIPLSPCPGPASYTYLTLPILFHHSLLLLPMCLSSLNPTHGYDWSNAFIPIPSLQHLYRFSFPRPRPLPLRIELSIRFTSSHICSALPMSFCFLLAFAPFFLSLLLISLLLQLTKALSMYGLSALSPSIFPISSPHPCIHAITMPLHTHIHSHIHSLSVSFTPHAMP